MIIKNFEIDKIKKSSSKYFLFYGDNQGLKDEIIDLLKNEKKLQKDIYYESEILKNVESFISSILTKSFFENEKFIVIKKASDKIKSIIEDIIEKNTGETTIILDSEILEKKSKLRSFFEKDEKLSCVAFYPDNNQTLGNLVRKFFKIKNVSISNETINLIVERANGQRQFLSNELSKITNFLLNKKKVSYEEIQQITNLGSKNDISELVDTCLSKNKSRLNNIINENNFSAEDVIIIIRTFLLKTKRLLKISENLSSKENIDKIISSHKPPIFWKDKDIIKNQLNFWTIGDIRKLITEINQTELLIKRNINISIIILIDFIFKQATKINN